MKMFCGLDFGTSNSALSAGSSSKRMNLVPLEGDNFTIPSAVFFNLEEKYTSFGRGALDEYRQGYEGRLMRSLKSILGSELIKEGTQVGNRKIDFRDIIGLFIMHLKNRAEKEVGADIENLVMGRPVYFVDDNDVADRQAEDELRMIATQQGFKNIVFEYEPLAAARDYESTLQREELVLVFDIGGGTSDFSVVRLKPDRKAGHKRTDDILANEGIHLGGTNFDQKLSMQTVMQDLGFGQKLKSGLGMPATPYTNFSTWHLINTMYTQKSISNIVSTLPMVEDRTFIERFLCALQKHKGHEIAARIEEAKIILSSEAKTQIDLDDIEAKLKRIVTASQLKKTIASDMEKISQTALNTVQKGAGIKNDHIQTIFLTGGSTGLPGFETAIAKNFPQAKIHYGDRFSSVAKGLGLAAAEIYG